MRFVGWEDPGTGDNAHELQRAPPAKVGFNLLGGPGAGEVGGGGRHWLCFWLAALICEYKVQSSVPKYLASFMPIVVRCCYEERQARTGLH